MAQSSDKVSRTLSIYTRLMNGEVLNRHDLAVQYGVDERSILRDINAVRDFLDDESAARGYTNSIIYDRDKKGYRIEQIYKMRLDNSEILAICKILLDSRSLTKKEMRSIIDRLIDCCVPKVNQEIVRKLIHSEANYYIQPRHNKVFLDKMWTIAQAISSRHYIRIDYTRLKDKKTVTRKLKPLAIMFSEYYFYIAAFFDKDDEVRKDFDALNDSFPTIYRLDRIQKLTVLDEQYQLPYNNRFEEGEFRKRIQFMYGGKLQKIKFKYTGLDVDAVLDRLPTAQIIDEEEGAYTIQAEVFGKGIEMWIRSQGENVSLINNKIEEE